MAKLARLARRCKFYDPDTKFRLSYGEEKPLPAGAGVLTKEWIQGGGILLRDKTPKPPKEEKIDPEVVREQKIERAMADNSLEDLRSKLQGADVRFSWRARERNLAEKVVDAGLE